MASSYVGGLSGAFIPVSEDQGMINAVEAGALTIEKLEAMTCVCSVGLDMIAIPGDTPATTISGVIADEAAIGMVNQKTTAVRIIPVVGMKVGEDMLSALAIDRDARFQTLSKGTQEKVQLVLTMSRRARLYLLDEPIGGVDPAARDYILHTIINNYDPDATVLISTHLISDVERVLDEFLFLYQGKVIRQGEADAAREESGKSLDELFREVFKCLPNC